jgi:hypothetical protein
LRAMAIVILLVRNGSSKCKHPISDSSSFTFSITFRIQTVIIICKRSSPKPQWSEDQSVGSYCSLLLTACSNLALRYVWQTLHILTCSYNELSTFLNAPILISSSVSGYIVKLLSSVSYLFGYP